MFGSNLGAFGSFLHKEKLVSVVSFNEMSQYHLCSTCWEIYEELSLSAAGLVKNRETIRIIIYIPRNIISIPCMTENYSIIQGLILTKLLLLRAERSRTLMCLISDKIKHHLRILLF